MNFPDNLKYNTTHEWIRVEGSHAYIGITEHGQAEFGEVVYVDVTTVNKDLKQGTIFGTIEALKTVSDLYIPLSGKVLTINSLLYDKPNLINEDPYDKGWIIKIEIEDAAEIDNLLSATYYKKMIGR